MRAIPLLAALCLLGSCTKSGELRSGEGLHHRLVPRLVDTDRKVEVYWEEPRNAAKPWPVVLYLHGNQEAEDVGGRTLYDWGVLRRTADLGYLAVAVSLPGFGESTGPRDFCGPDSQQAVQDVIRELRHRPDVSEDQFALVGVSRGATVAAKVGEQVAGIAALVLVSGWYDLGENYRRWKADLDTPEAQALAAEFEHESVMSDAGPLEVTVRERSVLPVPLIQSPTLVLDGARDPLTIPLQAEQLVRRLKGKGIEAKAVVYPEAGHRIPAEARARDIEPFLRHAFGK
jgi:dipeptidyl aminopeptidase/acylaminoacyl peptidase